MHGPRSRRLHESRSGVLAPAEAQSQVPFARASAGNWPDPCLFIRRRPRFEPPNGTNGAVRPRRQPPRGLPLSRAALAGSNLIWGKKRRERLFQQHQAPAASLFAPAPLLAEAHLLAEV